MASAELQRLWKLAQVDNSLTDIRHRAASLNVGQQIQARLTELQASEAKVSAEAKALSGELTDLELQQKSIDAKIAKFDKQLYDGTVVNVREVENIEKEIAMLKKQRGSLDNRILELWDLVPPAKAKEEAAEKAVAEAKAQLAERRKLALAEKEQLESEYKRLSAVRPSLATNFTPTLMAKYDNIRQRCNGIGMVEVTRKGTCAGCGLVLPEKTRADLNDDKTVTCEGCRRLLYWTDGVF